MVPENKAEYEAVRNEILRLQDSITNETIHMYVTYIALFSLGPKYSRAFLASFIVLIVFRAMINENQWELKKCSIFLTVFFEECADDLHWERLHTFRYYRSLREIRESKIGWTFYQWSATFLALLSLLALFVHTLPSVDGTPSIDTVLLLLAGCGFCVLTIYVNASFRYKESASDAMLRDCIREYKKSVSAERSDHDPHGMI